MPEVATGPLVREWQDGVKSPQRNFASLLDEPYDKDLMQYYVTGQLAVVEREDARVPQDRRAGNVRVGGRVARRPVLPRDDHAAAVLVRRAVFELRHQGATVGRHRQDGGRVVGSSAARGPGHHAGRRRIRRPRRGQRPTGQEIPGLDAGGRRDVLRGVCGLGGRFRERRRAWHGWWWGRARWPRWCRGEPSRAGRGVDAAVRPARCQGGLHE